MICMRLKRLNFNSSRVIFILYLVNKESHAASPLKIDDLKRVAPIIDRVDSK